MGGGQQHGVLCVHTLWETPNGWGAGGWCLAQLSEMSQMGEGKALNCGEN